MRPDSLCSHFLPPPPVPAVMYHPDEFIPILHNQQYHSNGLAFDVGLMSVFYFHIVLVNGRNFGISIKQNSGGFRITSVCWALYVVDRISFLFTFCCL